MSVAGNSAWMTPVEMIEETGLSRCAVYQGIKEGTLPIKAHKFGRRYLFSRREWERLQGISPEPTTDECRKAEAANVG